jgi:uncharacterized protein involved in response to NO
VTNLLTKGFRPFFLLAAVFAAAIVPVWLLVLGGQLAVPGASAGAVWHAHEMVHGFTGAVLAGFLLTAVGNWTGRETLTGAPLGGLALLWLAGRVACMAAPPGPAWTVDLAFLPTLALTLAVPLWRSGDRRNAVFPALLAGAWATDLAVHADLVGLWPGVATTALRVAVHLVAVVVLVITGRIVPAFTRNATGRADIRSVPWLDATACACALAVALLQPWSPGPLAGGVAAVGAVAVVARAGSWGASSTARNPLLWVLHAGHGWIALAFALEAAAAALPIPPSAPIHAITVGSIGTLTLGMMARVALGHTGRPLVAPRLVAAGFGAVLLAAAVRVFGPLVAPGHVVAWWWVAGALWAAAFATYAVRYAPILLGPRADGRPG